MESVDQELQQLKENYARMTEQELAAIAEDASDLTGVAREALQAVIAERGLQIELSTEPAFIPGIDPPPEEDLVVIDRVYDESEARRETGILDAAEIPVYIGPGNLTNLDDFNGKFEDGIDLRVAFFDRPRALSVLEKETEDKGDPEEGKAYAVLCPKCHSQAVVFQGRDPEEATGPAGEAKFDWSCDACGYKWKDEGIEQDLPAGQGLQEEEELSDESEEQS